jgi:hypothetical protein
MIHFEQIYPRARLLDILKGETLIGIPEWEKYFFELP